MQTLKLAITFATALAMGVLAMGAPAIAAAATTASKPIAAAGAATTAGKLLLPKDIKAQFATGKPITGVSLPGDKKYSLTLKADGTATMTLGSDKSTKTGTWHVSKTGYCSKWGTQPEHCYDVQKNGKQYDIVDATGKVVAHWSKS
jgi:hypothetical protein